MPTSTKTKQISEREAAFQAWGEMHADLPAEHDGLELDDPDVLREVTHRARRIRGRVDLRPYEVRKWLADDRRFSPHVDQVAVDRAMGLAHEDYVSLCTADRREMVRLLATMDDPFDTDLDFRGAIRQAAKNSAPGMGAQSTAPQDESSGLTARRMRWLSWPDKERHALLSSVHQYRSRNGLAKPRAVAA